MIRTPHVTLLLENIGQAASEYHSNVPGNVRFKFPIQLFVDVRERSAVKRN